MFIQSIRLRLHACCRIAGALALTGHGLVAQADPSLSLDQALLLAQQRSLQVVAQDAAASGARDMAVAAGQRPDPSLRVSLDALPINGPNRFSLTRDDFTMATIGVTQELTREGKRQARSTRFEREAATAEASRALVISRLQQEAAAAWLDRYHLERIRDALRTQRNEAGLQVDAAEAAYRGGRGSQADVFAARSAVALVEDRIDQIDSQVASAVTQLARWVGEDAKRPLLGQPATDSMPLSAEALEARFAHHPEIEVLQRKEAVAQAEADLAVAEKRPDWSVGLTYGKRGPAYADFVFLSLSVPLQWDPKNRQDRAVAARLAAVEQLRAERGDATRSHVAETLTMLQEWHGNRQRLARYDATLLPLATERTRAANAAYRGGGSGLMPLLEARRAEIDTRIEQLRLAKDTDRLWARLTYLLPASHANPNPNPAPAPALARP